MEIEKIEAFLKSKESVIETPSLLSKWEKEINFMLNKKIKQKIIIEFLLENDEDIKNKYQDSYSNFQSMVSKFCAKLKKSNRRKSKDENNIESNSSQSTNKEEPEKKSTGILSKIDDKKQEKKSFLPPREPKQVEDKNSNKKEIAKDFFSNTKK